LKQEATAVSHEETSVHRLRERLLAALLVRPNGDGDGTTFVHMRASLIATAIAELDGPEGPERTRAIRLAELALEEPPAV
jgi:hypothetical protein